MKPSLFRFVVILFFLFANAKYLSAQNKPQNLETLLQFIKSAKTDSLKVEGYLNLARYYDKKNQLDSTIFCMEKAAQSCIATKNKIKLAFIYDTLGVLYRQNEEYDKSLNSYDKSIELLHRAKDSEEFNVRLNKSILLERKAEYSKAMQELMICLKYFESSNDQVGQADTYKSMGRVFSSTSDNQKALEYYFKAKKILEKEKSYFSLSACLESIGSVYMDQKKYDLAINYHKQQLDIAKIHDLPLSHQGTAYTNIGLCYFEIGDFEKAIYNFQKSLEIRKSINSKEGMLSSYQKLCNVYLAIGNLNKALEYQKLALDQLLTSSKNPQMLTETYENLYQINEKKGNDKEAYKYYKNYVLLKDSLEGDKQKMDVEKIRSMYEFEKKQSQILALSNKVKLQEAEREKQEHLNNLLASEKSNFELNNQLLTKEKVVKNLEIFAQKKAINAQKESLKTKDKALVQERTIKGLLLGLMAILVSLAGFVFWVYQKEKKIKLSLQKANLEIENKNQQLDALNKTKDKLFSIIAHDLKSPVSDLHYFVKPFFNKHLESDEAAKINRKLEDLNTTMDNLLVWALQQSKSLKLDIKTEDIGDLIKSVAQSFESQLKNKNITLLSNSPSFSAKCDERKMEIVLRNLLSNAIKFTPEGGYIKIDSKKNNEDFEIEIKDTGAGMSSEELEKATQGLVSKDGTNGEKGTGLGLLICKEFVALHKGQLSLNSTPDHGTRVKIILPLIT
jgi:two-component system, sensor histidine kinase and response regulator